MKVFNRISNFNKFTVPAYAKANSEKMEKLQSKINKQLTKLGMKSIDDLLNTEFSRESHPAHYKLAEDFFKLCKALLAQSSFVNEMHMNNQMSPNPEESERTIYNITEKKSGQNWVIDVGGKEVDIFRNKDGLFKLGRKVLYCI